MKMFVALLASLASFDTVQAEPPVSGKTPAYVAGTGGFSCGKFIEYRRMSNNETQMDMIVQWVWGYLAAYNQRGLFDAKGHVLSQITPPDSPTVQLFLEHYCTQNPLSDVSAGAAALLKSLGGEVHDRPRSAAPVTAHLSEPHR
jgi:hypothetical protein